MVQRSAHTDVLVAAQVAASRAARLAAIWQAPLISDAEVAEVLHLPRSSWALLKRRGVALAPFSIGKRIFFHTADVREWVEKGAPGAKSISPTKPRQSRTSTH